VQLGHLRCTAAGIVTVARDIAAFAARASWGALSPRARHALKIRVLDSLGCAVAATGDRPPTSYVRSLLGDLGGAPTCTLIGGARAPADRAAFHNTALVRYLDFNDAYLAPGETCHPSDNVPAVLAAAQAAGASGETLLRLARSAACVAIMAACAEASPFQ
jgi:2-methylcitrate dehydratase